MAIAETILTVCFIYLICGLLVGVPFVLRGVDRVDPAARGAPFGFRLLILPGMAALWPLMAAKWLNAP
jgi:Trk-type K+ transport system membrane component